jgi:ubiquinone biosynthesis protein Coq4
VESRVIALAPALAGCELEMRALAHIVKGMKPLRTVKALYSLARLVADPTRLDDVFEMATALASPETMAPVVAELKTDPSVARAIARQHRVKFDLATLGQLPEGTLGRVFADHMAAANLDPAAIPTLPGGEPHEYVRAHLYETHDIWHVVTGFGTDFVGELGLQAFYLAQIPGPLPALLLAAGFLRNGLYDRALSAPLSEAITRGYAMGKAARPLFGVRWDELWETPMDEVRRELALAVAGAPAMPLAA